MHFAVVNERDVELLYSVIDAVIEEAGDREIEISAADVTFRLFAAYAMGERDHTRLVEAVLFPPSQSLH